MPDIHPTAGTFRDKLGHLSHRRDMPGQSIFQSVWFRIQPEQVTLNCGSGGLLSHRLGQKSAQWNRL